MNNNQEKLYIDIDEEITTIIDRLRHILSPVVFVVVPQRALLLQSIVNLKLLSQEAKKQRKRIVIMTKDEEGIVFASRAGIEVQPFVGSDDFERNSLNDNYFPNSPQSSFSHSNSPQYSQQPNFSSDFYSSQNQNQPNFKSDFKNNDFPKTFSENFNDDFYQSNSFQNNTQPNFSRENKIYSNQNQFKNPSRFSQQNSGQIRNQMERNYSENNYNYFENRNSTPNQRNFDRNLLKNGKAVGNQQFTNSQNLRRQEAINLKDNFYKENKADFYNQNSQNISNFKPQPQIQQSQFSNRQFSHQDQSGSNYQNSQFSNFNKNYENEEIQTKNEDSSYLDYLNSSKKSNSQISQNQTSQSKFSSDFFPNKSRMEHKVVDEDFFQFDQKNSSQNRNLSNSLKVESKSYAETFAQDLDLQNSANKFSSNSKNFNNNSFSQNKNQGISEYSTDKFSYLSQKNSGDLLKTDKNSFLNSNNRNSNLKKTIDKKNHIKSSSGFFSKFLIILAILVLGGVVFLYVFPKTDLAVKIKEVNLSENVELTAKLDQNNTDFERKIIPARQIKKEIVYSRKFDSTGKADLTAQKAQGMVVINNETDTDIKMIKTTRFISENGVLFHLANDVVIPKAKMEGTKKVNGTVKALLVAHDAGEKGNVKSPTFFVMTYKESDPEKYKKVYAKSESEMTGGGVGGKGMPVVTDDDIKKAKESMENSLDAFIQKEIADLVKVNEEVLSKEQISKKIISSNSKVAPNTATKEFSYEITAEVNALVFPQKNVDELVIDVIKKKNKDIDSKKLDVKYNAVEMKEDSNTLKMEALVMINYKPDFDIEQFKKDILGKDFTEIENLIKEKYPQIEGNISPKSFPSFLAGRISYFANMTKVSVE